MKVSEFGQKLFLNFFSVSTFQTSYDYLHFGIKHHWITDVSALCQLHQKFDATTFLSHILRSKFANLHLHRNDWFKLFLFTAKSYRGWTGGTWANVNYSLFLGSGWGSGGRAITSETTDLQFESSHWQILFTINCIGKTKIKNKRQGMANFITLLIVTFDVFHTVKNTFKSTDIKAIEQVALFYLKWWGQCHFFRSASLIGSFQTLAPENSLSLSLSPIWLVHFLLNPQTSPKSRADNKFSRRRRQRRRRQRRQRRRRQRRQRRQRRPTGHLSKSLY